MLHIINKSPFASNSLQSCLRVAHPGSTVLLIEDGIYAALRNTRFSATLDAARAQLSVCVLRPDSEARGVAEKVMEGVRQIDYADFVDLVAENERVQSWL
jgi:tRNA 2-thiouridine synthesizing protein B